MRILVVASPWLGGSGKVGLELAKALTVRNEVHFVSFDFPKDALRGSAVRSHVVYPKHYALFESPLYTESLAEHIIELCKAHRIDIIHAHYSLVFGTAAMIAKNYLRRNGYKTKLVTSFHGTDAIGFKTHCPGLDILRYMNAEVIAASDAVAVATDFMKKFVIQSIEEDNVEQKMHRVSYFVDVDQYCPKLSVSKRSDIVHASNYRPVKRSEQVLEACKLLRKLGHKNRFVFIGEGPELPDLKTEAKRLKLENVVFTGKISNAETAAHFGSALALLMPSEFENQSIAMLEAAASGAIPIACNVGGMNEFLQDGKNGFVVSSGKPAQAMADVVERLIKDKSLREKASASARAAARNLSLTKIVVVYEDLYKAIQETQPTLKSLTTRCKGV